MKRVLSTTMALLLAISPAIAQQRPTDMVDCAALEGVNLICFKNNSPNDVVGIISSSTMSYGSDWTTPHNGRIGPGGTTVVRLPSGWAGMRYVNVKTADGKIHVINRGQAIDIQKITTISINW